MTYVLTDDSGNVTECGFTVEVADVEAPTIVCPADTTIQLGPEECEAHLLLSPEVDDNCVLVEVTYDPPLDTAFPIGTTTVTITVTDEAGNSAQCSYDVTVLEYFPPNDEVACNDEINVTLGPDCVAEITADMILEGSDYRCYDNYIVTLYPLPGPGVPPLPTSPFVTLDEVGQTVIAEVCDPETGFCCWGYVNVEQYAQPEFDCPADITVTCNSETDPSVTGEPVITSCVPTGTTITFEDSIQDNDFCGDPRVVITRTWTVTDGLGNSSTCVQTITVDAIDLDQIEFPADLDNITLPALECTDVLANPALTHPDSTGYPTIDGSDDIFDVNYCTVSYLYTDEVYEICPGSYEILRYWKVRNTCLPVVPGENPREHIQVIKVLDTNGPDIEMPG